MSEEPKKPIFAYVLKKDTIFELHCVRTTQSWVLKAGEICHYFAHSDTYLFESRDGVVPSFSRKTVEERPEFFEPTEALSYDK